jgi:hypothetical protein
MIKSPMPPLQKFGFVAGLGAFGGIATVLSNGAGSYIDKKINTPVAPSNITPITSTTSKSNIHKFIDDSNSDSLQSIF